MPQADDEFRLGNFPPLERGCRVWTDYGYGCHGPVDGPKQDIAGPQGGEIIASEQLYYTIDQLVYTVRWDNGQVSKHYARELFSTGRFTTKSEFLGAFRLVGKVELCVGPRGGFKSVNFRVLYDGNAVESEAACPDDWKGIIEPAAARDGVEVVKISKEEAIRRQIEKIEQAVRGTRSEPGS